jgi:hypothetical protein
MKRYTNIKADNFCCIGAVLEVILIRNNYKKYSQYDIINVFGLTIPKTAKVSEKIRNITYSDNPNDWGVKLEYDSLNTFFKNEGINLVKEYISIREIANYSFELTLKSVSDEFDVVFGFDYGRLNNIPESYSIGHVGLFLKLEGENLLYFDPGPRNYGVRKVNIDDLYNAIKNKSDGLWIIKSTGHNTRL